MKKKLNKIRETIIGGSERTAVVKKNILGSLFVKGISIVISLMLVPLTLGYVSQELYGIWLTLSSVMMMLSFFDVGFSLGLKNKLTEAIAHGQWEKGKALVSTTYFMMIVIFITLLVILEFLIPVINWCELLNVSTIYEDDIIKSMSVVAACFCMQMIFNTISMIVAAFQKVALSSSFPVIGNLISLIAILILTHTCDSSLLILTITLSTAPIIVLILTSLILFSTIFKRVKPSIKYVSKDYIRNLWGLGYKFFLIQIQVVVVYQATNFLISNISGPNDVTAYNIAHRYLNVSLMLFNIIIAPLWPAFTDAYSKNDYRWLNSVYIKMTKLFVFSAIIMSLMVILSPIAYNLWIQDKAFVPISMTFAVFLYMFVNTWNNLNSIALNGVGKIKIQTIISIVVMTIHIPLSLCIGTYLGGEGVLYSLAILTALSSLVYSRQIKLILQRRATGIWNE